MIRKPSYKAEISLSHSGAVEPSAQRASGGLGYNLVHHSPLATHHSPLTPHDSRLPGPAGFTLLEIILALSLSVLLLAALYTALKLHLTMARRGPEEVRKAQIARAVLERIARDVRATIPQAKVTASSAASSSSSGTASSTDPTASGTGSASSSATTSTTEVDLSRNAFGVLGGSDWVQLYVIQNQPNVDDAERMASSGSVAQASNVLRVTYSLSSLTMRHDSKGRTYRMGLARSQVASIASQRLDSGLDDADYRASTDFLVDDVGQLQFQYWSDSAQEWVDSWGTDTPIAPPRAIKVFVSLLQSDEYLNSQLGLSGSQSTWTPNFQMVIPIPAWSSDASSSSSSAGSGATASSTAGSSTTGGSTP